MFRKCAFFPKIFLRSLETLPLFCIAVAVAGCGWEVMDDDNNRSDQPASLLLPQHAAIIVTYSPLLMSNFLRATAVPAGTAESAY